jgi:hypothetical protein
VDQRAPPRRRAQRPHPPPQRAQRHALRRRSRRRGRHPLRGPAPAADDGRPAPPRRRARGRPQLRPPRPRPGDLYLWESWLRHEVEPHAGPARGGERVSLSFNYAWG